MLIFRCFIVFLLTSFSLEANDNSVVVAFYEDGVTVRSIERLPLASRIGVSLFFGKSGDLQKAKTTHLTTTVNNEVTFFLAQALETQSESLRIIDFTLSNRSFHALYQRFLSEKITEENNVLRKNRPLIPTLVGKTESNSLASPLSNQLLAPQVTNPKVALGLKFLPNGRNKLYTKTGEIWMDGDFKKGQLMDGKVFLYDSDQVLLKVRIYKNGAYERDGLL